MKKNKAFTLIEILVWMAILTILIMWATRVNFNYSTNNQKLEIFNNKIASEIETARNNSLIWKWVGSELIIPDWWKIDFSTNWSWVVITSYLSWTWIENNKVSIDEWYSISNINCSSDLIATETWTIFFDSWEYSLWTDCPTNYTKINIETSFRMSKPKNIEFNSISWLIKK